MANKTKEQREAEEAAKKIAAGEKITADTQGASEPVVLDSISEALEETQETPVIPGVTGLGSIPGPNVIQTPATHVPFNAEQMEIINAMIANAQKRGVNEPISVYGQRDPRIVTTVKVSQFEGKFVTAFKNLQMNPFKKEPKYSTMKPGYMGKAAPEPYVTLILSNNGTDFVEKEVALVDFMDNRDKVEVPVVHTVKEEVIKDYGVLGRQGNTMAVAIDENGRPMAQVNLKAETKEVITKYYVQLPGFAHPVEFIGNDFLA